MSNPRPDLNAAVAAQQTAGRQRQQQQADATRAASAPSYRAELQRLESHKANSAYWNSLPAANRAAVEQRMTWLRARLAAGPQGNEAHTSSGGAAA